MSTTPPVPFMVSKNLYNPGINGEGDYIERRNEDVNSNK